MQAAVLQPLHLLRKKMQETLNLAPNFSLPVKTAAQGYLKKPLPPVDITTSSSFLLIKARHESRLLKTTMSRAAGVSQQYFLRS